MPNPVSLRASLGAVILVLGVFAVVAVLVSASIYRRGALESERFAAQHAAAAAVNHVRKELETKARGLAVLAQSDPNVMSALTPANRGKLETYLDRLFKHPLLTAGDIRFSAIYLYDGHLNLAGASPEGIIHSASGPPACLALKTRLAELGPHARGHPRSALCAVGNAILMAVIVPLRKESAVAYIEVVADMVGSITASGMLANMPITLSYPEGPLLYRSHDWPNPDVPGFVVGEYRLGLSGSGHSVVEIAIAKPTTRIADPFESMQYVIGLATAGLILVGLAIADRTAIRPLQTLARRLKNVKNQKPGEEDFTSVGGNVEILEIESALNEIMRRFLRLNRRVAELTGTDGLTGLPDRTRFYDAVEQMIADRRSGCEPFALLIMDLDRFKDINDTLGHRLGDTALQEVSRRVREKLRDCDVLARMGGDEFAVLLPGVNGKNAVIAARMLIQSLRGNFAIDGNTLDIETSIGIAVYPDDGIDANILIQRADAAMYAAKHANSGYALYDGSTDTCGGNRPAVLAELRQALDREQFVLYYQPKADLATHRVVGVEALVRWRHPAGELLLPGSFVPLLEQGGLIRNVTQWVLTEALRQCSTLHAHGFPISISVNLSVRDLQDPHFVDLVYEQLLATKVRPDWLVLEITETAVMTDPECAIRILTRLSDIGLRLAIDDFGTGYSSLAYLKKLPVTEVKIDKTFINGMTRDESDAAIVRASIELAQALGLQIVAEGVEDENMLRRLRELRCPVAQGIYISRPLTASELVEWLEKSSWGLGRRPLDVDARTLDEPGHES